MDDENDAHTTTRTSTHASSIDIQPSSENVTRLVLAIGKEEMSVKSMMEAVGLKNRPNFMDYSLTPAIREGFVCMKYPANPHHPRQRYLLTIKGLMLLDGNNSQVLNKSKAFVRHYPKNFVSFGQMLIISLFIDLTPILNLF